MTGYEPFYPDMQRLRDNKDKPTVDLRDDKNNFKITYEMPPSDTTVPSKEDMDEIGTKMKDVVSAAEPCVMGTPILSEGGTMVEMHGTCLFRDVEAADKGQFLFEKQAALPDKGLIAEAVASILVPELRRRLGAGRSLAETIKVAASSTKGTKNCVQGEVCASSSERITAIPPAIIALLIIVGVIAVVGIAIFAVIMIQHKKSKSPTFSTKGATVQAQTVEMNVGTMPKN
jgi:hypothetical protein